ncbi:hypothetical protein D3C72_1473810 [compost metagenome]
MAVPEPGMPRMVNAPVPPTPLVRNGSKISVLRKVAESSRPRRTSPKLPSRLTVERRLKPRPLVPAALPAPVSESRPASSQKPAFRSPPRSSVPRKPRRLMLAPPVARPTLLDEPEPESRVTLVSMTPKISTLDWAAAAPARLARPAAITIFFMVLSLFVCR